MWRVATGYRESPPQLRFLRRIEIMIRGSCEICCFRAFAFFIGFHAFIFSQDKEVELSTQIENEKGKLTLVQQGHVDLIFGVERENLKARFEQLHSGTPKERKAADRELDLYRKADLKYPEISRDAKVGTIRRVSEYVFIGASGDGTFQIDLDAGNGNAFAFVSGVDLTGKGKGEYYRETGDFLIRDKVQFKTVGGTTEYGVELEFVDTKSVKACLALMFQLELLKLNQERKDDGAMAAKPSIQSNDRKKPQEEPPASSLPKNYQPAQSDSKKTADAKNGDIGLGTAGFVSLFNGKDLNGWRQWGKNDPNASVEGGRLVFEGVKPGKTGFIATDSNDFVDFQLRAKIRCSKDGNTGVLVHVNDFLEDLLAKRENFPYEGAILGTKAGYLAHWDKLKGSHTIHFDGVPVTPNEWYLFEMNVEGNAISVSINGREVGAYVDTDGLLRPAGGRICIESASGKVEFESIEVKRHIRK